MTATEPDVINIDELLATIAPTYGQRYQAQNQHFKLTIAPDLPQLEED